MRIVDKMGNPIEEGAVLYRLDDQMKYKVVRVTPAAITYELTTLLPEPKPEEQDHAMVASNFIRLYDPPKVRVQ